MSNVLTRHLITVKKDAPFRISEQGWGEFDMQIILVPFAQPKGEQTIFHDLNFQSERYEANHTFTFRNPKPELIERLRESGSVGDAAPAAVNGGTKAGAATGEKRKKSSKTQVDMEKLAEGLERLAEDDLLHVVQMVHDNKSDDTYTKNDVESESKSMPVGVGYLDQGLVANHIYRRRIPRRSLYSPRSAYQDALGFRRHKGEHAGFVLSSLSPHLLTSHCAR